MSRHRRLGVHPADRHRPWSILGPERLPEYAAKLGRLVRQARVDGRGGQGSAARADGPGVRRHRLEAVRPAPVRPAAHRPRGAARPGRRPTRTPTRRRSPPQRRPRRRRSRRPTTTRPPDRPDFLPGLHRFEGQKARFRCPPGNQWASAADGGQAQRTTGQPPRARAQAAGDGAQRHGGRRVGVAQHDGLALVGALAQRRCRAGSGPAAATVGTDRTGERLGHGCPPPDPKISWREPSGSSSHDMFSMTPTMRWWVCRAMDPARSATSAAACCGVVTTRISALGDELGDRDGDVARARRAGRAAGRRGRPRRRRRGTAAARGAASGPRHTTGWLPGTNMPIEMTFTSWLTGGRIMSSTWVGRCWTPSIRGTEKP